MYAIRPTDKKKLEEEKKSSEEALHWVLLIHFSLSITVIYANE